MAVDQCHKCGDVFFEIRYCNNCDGSPVKKLETKFIQSEMMRRRDAATTNKQEIEIINLKKRIKELEAERDELAEENIDLAQALDGK